MRKIRIVLMTQGVSRVVDPLLKADLQIVGVVETASKNIQYRNRLARYFYCLVEWFSSVLFNRLTLKKFCKKNAIGYFFYYQKNEKKLQQWIMEKAPDLAVVYSMPLLLKENIFNLPKMGTINLHSSFLPEYRGPNPDFWQYYDMVEYQGVTVHYLDKGEDTGNIINQKRVHIPIGMKNTERLDSLIGQAGVSILLDSIYQLQKGIVRSTRQPKESPTVRARNIKQVEYAQLVNWEDWEIERVWNLLRGTERWINCIPQPQGILCGQHWEVKNYIRCDTSQFSIGVVYKENNKSFISCKDGKIYLETTFKVKRVVKCILSKFLFN